MQIKLRIKGLYQVAVRVVQCDTGNELRKVEFEGENENILETSSPTGQIPFIKIGDDLY